MYSFSVSPSSASNSSPKKEQSRSFTADQVTLVQKVLRATDYYEILSVQKECSESELKKAYKKV